MQQLEGLDGGCPGGELQLEPGPGPLHLPGLVEGGAHAVRQILHPDVGHVPGGLHRVQGVLPGSDSGHGVIVLQGGDGQPIGEGDHLQRLCFDQLPLSLGHSMGSECSLGSCLHLR